MKSQYPFMAYILTVACAVAIFSIWQKSDVGIGFAGGIVGGAFGAMQTKKEEGHE